jgi:hypothetical protein
MRPPWRLDEETFSSSPRSGRSPDADPVLPGGSDWTVKRSDGVVELDLRITLETDDGPSST